LRQSFFTTPRCRLAGLSSWYWAACTAIGTASSSLCAEKYVDHINAYVEMSTAITRYVPEEFSTNASWESLLDAMQVDMHGSQEATTLRLLDKLYSTAQSQLMGCWVHGGRYWSTSLPVEEIVRLIAQQSPPDDLHNVQQILSAIKSWDSGTRSHGALCAPWECDRPEIEEEVFPRLLGQLLRLPKLSPLRPSHLDVFELSDWSRFKLDFVIAGVSGCGSSSLRRNLGLHPSIDFTSATEDPLLFQYDILPSRAQVEDFNRQREGHTHRPRILGLHNPMMFGSAIVRQILSLIPNLQVVVIACDLLSRFEKFFFEDHYCHPDMERALQSLERRKRPPGAKCQPSIRAALEDPSLRKSYAVGPHLENLRNLFGPRVWMVHQEHLRTSPGDVYNALAISLGAGPFPSHVKFHRYNSRRGHRTDLCHNMTLVRELQRAFAEDYAAVERAMAFEGPVPAELLLRTTRCDRPSELNELAPRCPNATRCRV